jgi:hypothetical protein
VKWRRLSGVGDDVFYVATDFGTSLYVKKGATAIGLTAKNTPLGAEELRARRRTWRLRRWHGCEA